MNPYQEFLSCQQDFSYFAENYLKINHPVRGTIPLKLYPFQKKLLDIYEKNKFVLALKFRQGGFTSISLLHAFWNCMFKSGITYGISCTTEQESIHLSKVVDKAVANLPDWFLPKFSKNTQTEKSFSITGSRMIFGSMESISGKRGRYLNLTHLFIDEAAFIPNMKEKWENFMLFNQENNINIYGISTPNGVGNWFEETWTNAEKGRNSFVVHHPDYRENPIYQDEAELNSLRQRLGEKAFRQEVLGEFIIEEPEFGKVIYLENKELINMGIKALNSTKISSEEKAAIHEIIRRLSIV